RSRDAHAVPTRRSSDLGKRKAFMGARGRREWDVSFDLVGSREVAGLVEVARSAGEVMWYPADATSGNLLSPQASGFEVTPANARSEEHTSELQSRFDLV